MDKTDLKILTGSLQRRHAQCKDGLLRDLTYFRQRIDMAIKDLEGGKKALDAQLLVNGASLTHGIANYNMLRDILPYLETGVDPGDGDVQVQVGRDAAPGREGRARRGSRKGP